MKGIQSIDLTAASVREAVEDYLNKHMKSDRAIHVIDWMHDGYGDGRVLKVKFSEPGEDVPKGDEPQPL